MPRASAAQTVLPLGDQPEDIFGWDAVSTMRRVRPDSKGEPDTLSVPGTEDEDSPLNTCERALISV
jgi:hypothetical protein